MLHTTAQNGHSSRIGKAGEDTFQAYAKACGWAPKKASAELDKKHVDFILQVAGYPCKVDVKGYKNSFDMGLILVELLNVRGDKGWLFGEADWIAFQREDGSFLTVDRVNLVKLIKSKLNWAYGENLDQRKQSNNKHCKAPFWYRRSGRQDAITNLTLKEVEAIA